jgi:6-phosphogluconolactonase
MSMHRHPGPVEAAQACAQRILKKLESVHAARATSTLAISGGSSPRLMFEIFSRTTFPWDKVHLFWVDERIVPPTDPQSNYKLAFDTWLGPTHFPPANIHRVEAELGAEEAARRYREDIHRHFQLQGAELPAFDVIHRGMGPDGHTASLFPGEPLVADRTGVAAPVWVEKMKQWRVTLLPGVLEAAHHTVMLVTGSDKASMLLKVLDGPYRPDEYPAQIAIRIVPTSWFLDDAACAELPPSEETQ